MGIGTANGISATNAIRGVKHMGLEIDLNNLPDSPEDLQKFFDQMEAGEMPAPDEPKMDSNTGEASKEVSNQEQAAKNDPANDPGQSDDDAAGVATKDGKRIIPYTVLKSERELRHRAEQFARDAQARVETLQAQLNEGSQGAKQGESARTEQLPEASELDQEDLEALKEDFPTVYKALMVSMATSKAIEAKLAPVAETVHTQEAERTRTAAQDVQEAIDSVPKLSYIQSTNKDAFELAKQFDATLRDQPTWQGKTLAERFAKVAEMVESAIGQIELPNQPQKATPSAEDMAKAAKELAAKASKANRSNVPTSLSEFPAGQHAAESEAESIENMSPQQLAEKFNAMTPDQMDAYFRNL